MKNYWCLFGLFFLPLIIMAQEEKEISVFFWNLENHFHPENDSLTMDDEFTPEGERYWGYNRYWSKNARLWKTIISSGTPNPPDIIALAEVENEEVIRDLFVYSPPGIFEYHVIHKNSEDWRGIDVAILYNAKKLKLVRFHFIKIDLGPIGGSPTRDILYVRFKAGEDTLDVFVNHWPSKYGGVGVTDKFRVKAAKTLLATIDTLLVNTSNAKLIVLGDFNDIPGSNCLNLLLSNPALEEIGLISKKADGTIKYQGRWEYIDHIFLSKSLLENTTGFRYENGIIYSPEFLFERDEKYGGIKPFRTWNGYRYQEGFSDHLPVILTLESPGDK